MVGENAQAVVVPVHGGPDVLEVREIARPRPGRGQLLVQVAASGVNFIDVYRREGIYPTAPPFVLGSEAAGTVLEVGPEVGEFAVGDIVASSAVAGSHATLAIFAAAQTVPVPAGLDPQIAAAALLQGITAHYLVNSTYPLGEGEKALVHAAAGGVGQLLVQLAKARGAYVVATVGTAAKRAIAADLGADKVIRYDEVDDLAMAVRAASGGGVHVVYDSVGRSTFDASLGSLLRRGMLVLFGASSGQVPPFEIQRLNHGGSLYLTRPTSADYTATRAELLWRAEEIFAGLDDGSLRLQIGGRYSLAEAAQAYRDLEARRTTGKLIIVP